MLVGPMPEGELRLKSIPEAPGAGMVAPVGTTSGVLPGPTPGVGRVSIVLVLLATCPSLTLLSFGAEVVCQVDFGL